MNFFRTIGKDLTNAERAVVKGAVDTGHAVGAAANNPLVQTVALGALAATGAGAVAEVAAGSALAATGQVLKKGGGSKNLAGAIVGGAARGAAVAVVATGVRNAGQIGSFVSRVTSRGASTVADAGTKVLNAVAANPKTAAAIGVTAGAAALAEGTKPGLPGSTGAHTATDTSQGDNSQPTTTQDGGGGGSSNGDSGGGAGGGGGQGQGSPSAPRTTGKNSTMLYVLGAVALGAGVLFLSPKHS